MRVTALQTLLAIKTIVLTPNLPVNDRRVACLIIEHYSRRTGQCDPGHERLADLLGIDVRTVIRAIDRLVAAGLFRKIRHGGRLNRNSYEPDWDRLAELHREWQTIFAKGRQQQQATGVSVGQGQPCHLPADTAVTQTYLPNLQMRTYGKGAPREELRRRREQRPNDAARATAERRWSSALHDIFSADIDAYSEVIAAVDSAISAAATDAEIRRHGAGLELILDQLKLSPLRQPAFGRLASSHEGHGSSLAPHPLAVVSDPDDTSVMPAESRVDDG